MKVTFLRGACVVIETEDCRILCDPWLTDGCYYGAWAHFPEFTDWHSPDLQNIDFIYVSHIHPDHFDKPTMMALHGVWEGRTPPVLIHKYPFSFFRKQIEDLCFDVIECAHGETVTLSQRTKLRIFSADGCDPRVCGSFYGCTMPGVVNTQIDSLAVFDDGHSVAVNVNDCPYPLSANLCKQIAQEYPKIDLALVAYAGAGPFPQCFTMSALDMLQAKKRKCFEFIENVSKFARALNARRVLPFAGDYQLCGKLSRLNEFRGVPELRTVHAVLNAMDVPTASPQPGETFDVKQESFPELPDTIADRVTYVDDVLAYRVLDYEFDRDPGDAPKFLFPDAFARFEAKRRQFGGTWRTTAYLKEGDGYFMMPPEGGWSYVAKIDREDPYVSIETDPRLLAKLLAGPGEGAHWNNAQIGSHIRFDRQPVELYEPALYHLLSYLHA